VTSVNSVTRVWNDLNGNYLPDCDLKNPRANLECGQISNLAFGQRILTTRYSDSVLNGFGARDYFWDFAAQVQHQLGPRVSLNAGYYRNWSNRFHTAGSYQKFAYPTRNLAVSPADFSPYCITAPSNPLLPNGGGYPVCGLYDVAPGKFGLVDNLVSQASE
jgi:hypothetical protein